MNGLPTVDLPDVVRQVEAAFLAYERALNENDVDVLNDCFWDDPRVLRFGVTENLYGHPAITDFRRGRRAPPPRRLGRTLITAFGTDCAGTAAEFFFPGDDRVGRQTQLWIRTEAGWRIAAAHVSFTAREGIASP